MNRTDRNTEEKFLEFSKMFPPFIRDLDTDLCQPTIATGWEWCFDPSKCYVLEKLNGTNVKLEVVEGVLTVWVRNQNSKAYIEATLNNPDYKYILQGVANLIAKRKKRLSDGTRFGELVGEKLQGNPYKMEGHIWLEFTPFKDGVEVYRDHPQTDFFEDWKTWILQLKSLYNPEVESEGVIFLNKETGEMAKLRKDMFDIKYQPKRRKRKRK